MRQQKLDQRNQLITEQRAFLDANPNVDFSKDEAYQRRDQEIASLTSWLKADENLSLQERASDSKRQTGVEERSEQTPEEKQKRSGEAFAAYVRAGEKGMTPEQRSALSTSTAGAGVPLHVANQIIQDVTPLSTVRKYAEIFPVVGNTNIPIFNDAVAAFKAEEASLSDTDPSLDIVELKPTKIVARTSMSWEVLNRFQGDLLAQVRKSFARSSADAEDKAYLIGSGSDEPDGLFTAADTGVEADAADEFTVEELLKLWASVKVQHRNSGTWVMNSLTAAFLRTLKDGNDVYVYRAGLQDGIDRIMGRPVEINDHAPAMETGLKPIAFGDLSEYKIAEETNMIALRDDFTHARNGQVRFYLYRWVDGRLAKANAVKVMEMD